MITVKADDRRRVQIPDAHPGQVFAYEKAENGAITLTEVVKKPANQTGAIKSRLVKENGFTVVETDIPIDEEALKQALAEFP